MPLSSTGQAQDLTILTGSTITLDSGQSEGHPETIEWFVTRPGEQTPTQPTSTLAAFEQMFDIWGTWTVTLNLAYAHLDFQGSPWSSSQTKTVEARSVVADLQVDPMNYRTSDTILLDGTASQIATSANARFLVNDTLIGACSRDAATSTADLVCEISAGDLGEGDHRMLLRLINGDEWHQSGVTITVADPPPFTVDFSWLPDNPDPGAITQMNILVPDGYTIDDLASMSWWWDDGSPLDETSCPLPFGFSCSTYSHRFNVEGFYDVTLTVTTTDGQAASVTHEITVGDPPLPPTAEGQANPNPAMLRQPVSYSFTGSCEDICSYDWDFGDGSRSNSRDVSHQYVQPGTYSVTVEAANSQGSDSATFDVPVTACWSPTEGIFQTGSCYGALVRLSAPDGAAWIWDTGASIRRIQVSQPGSHWVNVEHNGTECWAYLAYSPTFDACTGVPSGNVNMDDAGRVDAADLTAILRELADGDGDLVIDMGAGNLGAPGADLTGASAAETDGRVTVHDHVELVEILFAVGA